MVNSWLLNGERLIESYWAELDSSGRVIVWFLRAGRSKNTIWSPSTIIEWLLRLNHAKLVSSMTYNLATTIPTQRISKILLCEETILATYADKTYRTRPRR